MTPFTREIAGPATVTTDVVGRRNVVSVAGEIDLTTAPALTDAIETALEGGAQELWVDLTPTGFMDCSGVHALLAAETQARRLNRRLAVICPARNIRRVLDITGVSAELAIYDDRAQAHRAA
jgi:anti-anti-sigma factor